MPFVRFCIAGQKKTARKTRPHLGASKTPRRKFRYLLISIRLRRLERVFLLMKFLRNDERLQIRISNGVGKLYVSLELYCSTIF